MVSLFALLASEPGFDQLWTAHAQCDIPSNVSTETTRITNFTYDFDGHLTQVNCPEGVINYGYDLATGRHISTCTKNSYVEYGYDELGRLKTVHVLKRNNASVDETTTYTYDAVGNRSSVQLPNGVLTTYLYDSLNRLTNLTHQAGTTNLASYSYQLHPTGRRTNAVEILRQENDTYLTNKLTWQYDGMYRLTNEVNISTSLGGNYAYTNAFQYDLAGNRFKQIKTAGGNVTTTTNLYNANDHLLREVTLVSGSPTGTNSYAYDLNGSVAGKTNKDGIITYAYNLANKLSSVTGPGGTASYQYNDQGIRVRTITGASTKYYLVDANNHTSYTQVLEEFNVIGGTPTLAMSYVIGDDVLAQASDSSLQPSALLYDGHGSTRQVINSTLGVASKYNYDAYGVTLDNSYNPSGTSLRYCGEQYDDTLGMYNLRARYYDPSNGRFNQRDTFAGNNFDPQSLHKYTYCGVDPVNNLDPSGNMELGEILVVVGIILNVAGLLFHAYRSNIERASGRTLEADRDRAWAMVDFLFLLIPGSGLIGPGLETAGEATEAAATATSLLQAGVRASAVWGYLTTLFSVATSGGGGGGGSNVGGSNGSSNEPGEWGPENNSGRSPESIQYEKQITGREGQAYYVKGVKFDGWNGTKLLDAKDHYSFLLQENGTWQDWFDSDKWVELADRQFQAASGCPIEWHFAEKEVADAVKPLIGGKVTVIYTPHAF